MAYCPLISYQHRIYDRNDCIGKNCAFSDENGKCLITQALQTYIIAVKSQPKSYTYESSPSIMDYAPQLIEHYKSLNDPEGWGGLQGGL